MSTQEEFGNSWHYNMPEDEVCQSTELPGMDPCDGFENITVAEGFCSVITNSSGKIKER